MAAAPSMGVAVFLCDVIIVILHSDTSTLLRLILNNKMAYKKADMIKQSLKAIEEHSLVFVEEIISFVPFSKRAFYYQKLHECNEITTSLYNQKVSVKSKLRKIWAESKSPALQIALYKLLATEVEYERLIQQKIDHTSKDQAIVPTNIIVPDAGTSEKLKEYLDGGKTN